MSSSNTQLAATFTEFVATLTGHPIADLPRPEASGPDWRAVLLQWLARQDCGLVSIANPGKFSWAGHWLGIVESPETSSAEDGDAVAVLLFGTPSAVIASPNAPALLGKAVEDLRFREGFVLVPFQPFKHPSYHPPQQAGVVVGIYLSEVKTGPMRSVEVATALQGRGLLGDRYAAKAGTFTPRSDRLKGYDLTLIEGEVLDRVTLSDGSRLAPEESRRNLVTRGIALNALVGREFQIGAVRVFGQRLCEPCVHLQRLTRPGVITNLVHAGGLRVDVLTDGEIRVGDQIEA